MQITISKTFIFLMITSLFYLILEFICRPINFGAIAIAGLFTLFASVDFLIENPWMWKRYE